jgi:hypothetical protein
MMFFISFISIQLVEYFTWKNLNNKKINTLLSKIGLLLVIIQPILSLQVWYSTKDRSIILLLQGLYIIIMLLTVYYYPIDFSMYKESNGHLAWNWLKFPPFIYVLWVGFFIGFSLYKKEYYLFLINIFMVAVIYYTYYKTNTWGSMWCWISNIASVILLISVFFGPTVLSNCLLSNNLKNKKK